MTNNLLVQLISSLVLVAALIVSGSMLAPILRHSDEASLRYTETSVEGAPPIVAIGTSIGALRGIIVDILWLRVQLMKEKGLFYQAQTDADLITKLQPRFGPVWSFHGHNMAYNISVATHTVQERWQWVNRGIDLVRNQGLRYNPNDIVLYKDLAFWLQHKIEGVSDDAHLYYKREFAREWHKLLGVPPSEHQARIEWIKGIADAPDRVEQLDPKTRELIDELRAVMSPMERLFSFGLDRNFLFMYSDWLAVKTSPFAVLDSAESRMRAEAEKADGDAFAKLFVVFDRLAADESRRESWSRLLAFIRKKTLREEYNMEARLMYEYTRDLGPIDWRHASAHSLYWARLGSQRAERRAHNDDDLFKIINNDRMQAHAMQDLARFGLVSFDPLANDNPSRLPDTRWIRVIDDHFMHLYVKHRDVDGWGPDNFIAWHKHFLESSVRELHRMGDVGNAELLLDRLDGLYGSRALTPNPQYKVPLETFVMQKAFEEYEAQPHVATTDVQNALYYGIRAGLGRGRRDIYDNAKSFADKVLTYFKTTRYTDFVNKFGEGRLKDLIGSLEESETDAFIRVMVDQQASLDERLRIWMVHATPILRVKAYDLVYDTLARDILRHEYFGRAIMIDGRQLSAEEHVGRYIPEPEGLEQFRAWAQRERERMQQEEDTRATIQSR